MIWCLPTSLVKFRRGLEVTEGWLKSEQFLNVLTTPGLEQQPLQRSWVPPPGISAQREGKEMKCSGSLAESVMSGCAALDVTGSGPWGQGREWTE